MKFKVFLILILCLSLFLAGCQTETVEPTVPPETTQPTQPPVPKAGLLLRQQTADEKDTEALTQCLEQLGYEVLVRDGENDQSKQNDQLSKLLESGCRILVVQPVMTTGLEALVEQVKPTGVPLVILDHQPEQTVLESYDKLVFLGPDHTQAGAVQAQLWQQLPLGGDLNFDGTVSVVIIGGPEDHLDAQERSQAFLEAMPADTHVILEAVTGDWTAEGGRSAAAQMLAKYGPDIEVLITFDAAMGLGTVEAIQNGGWTPGRDLYVLTVGGCVQVMEQLEQSNISGTAAPDNDARIAKLAELVAALAAGEAPEKVNLIDYVCYSSIIA